MSEDRTFEYLLNAMEGAAQSDSPFERGYGDKRKRVLQHVADLKSDYLRRHKDACDYLDVLLMLQHRCGYIINFCKGEKEMRLEAEEMLRVVKAAIHPVPLGDKE